MVMEVAELLKEYDIWIIFSAFSDAMIRRF